MSEFFNNLKADLTDRRLMPLVALVVIAVVAAVGWALLSGGSSSSSTTVHAVVLPTGPAPGLATTTVTPEKALAETATGYAAQRHGSARNPFLPLPGSGTATASSRSAATASTASTSSTASSSSSSSSGSGSSSASTTPAKPSTPKTKTVYRVAVLFGSIPAGTTPANAQLTAYENLKPATPLPDAKNPLVVYRGVTQGKKATATFTIVGEVILHGEGSCLPEPQNCAAINLAPGKSEQLEYTPPGGQTILYELRVVSIASATATAAAANRQLSANAQGQALLRSRGLLSVPDLVYARPDMLVFPSRRARASRAHTALRRRHGR